MASFSQISDTNTGQYDQIFALSQGYLNKSIAELYNSLTSIADHESITIKNIAGKMVAKMAPPQVAVDVFGERNMIFYVNIVSGTLTLLDNDSGDPIGNSLDVPIVLDNCRIALKVNISLEGIESDDKLHTEIMKQLHNVSAADYSLKRLFMDLSAVDISSVLGAPETIMPDVVLNSNGDWVGFINKWLQQLHAKKANTLGYRLDALDPKKSPVTFNPTFQPVWNQFQTSEWRFDDGKPKQGLTDGNNNSLLYLQMTAPHDAPKDDHYSFTGNMVGDGESGSLFISRELFWDKWLLRELRKLSYYTLVYPTRAHCSNNELSPDWDWQWAIGEKAAQHLNFKDEFDPFYDFQPTLGNQFSWQWNQQHREEDSGGSLFSKLGCYIDCSNHIDVSYKPDSNTITATGKLDTTIERNTDGGGTAHANIHFNWHLDIELDELSNEEATKLGLVPGGLLVRVMPIQFDNPQVDTDGRIAMTPPTGAKDDIIAEWRRIDFDQMRNKIQGAVSGVHQLILPGSGTFKVARPRMNRHGDLLCHLDYLPKETNDIVNGVNGKA